MKEENKLFLQIFNFIIGKSKKKADDKCAKRSLIYLFCLIKLNLKHLLIAYLVRQQNSL